MSGERRLISNRRASSVQRGVGGADRNAKLLPPVTRTGYPPSKDRADLAQ
jgi:hypothetical protein